MERFTLNTKNTNSQIYFGENIAANLLKKICSGRQTFIVTDSNVNEIYGSFFEVDADIHIIKAGEKSKNFTVLQETLKTMANAKLRRNAILIAFGGGVVGDLAGLAAALYMRGIEAIQVPTTLLSQVDSSIGGKTAVNLSGIKNIIGTFYQPKTVICDTAFLNTLKAKDIRCGLGEIIKTAALDANLFEKVYLNKEKLKNPEIYKSLILPCIKIKAEVVKLDEFETKGIRKTLNLGHTTGHALEIFYGKKTHGEYVLEGILIETQIAKMLKLCDDSYANKLIECAQRIVGDIKEYNDLENTLKLAVMDKKNTKDAKVSLIIATCKGKAQEVELEISKYIDLVKKAVKKL